MQFMILALSIISSFNAYAAINCGSASGMIQDVAVDGALAQAYAVNGFGFGEILSWDIASGAKGQFYNNQVQGGSIRANTEVMVTKDSKYVLGVTTNEVLAWNAASANLLKYIPLNDWGSDHSWDGSKVRFSPDESRMTIVRRSWDNSQPTVFTMEVYEFPSFKKLYSVEGLQNYAYVALSSDPQIIFTVELYQGKTQLLKRNIAAGAIVALREIFVYQNEAIDIYISPDSQHLLLKTGQQITSLDPNSLKDIASFSLEQEDHKSWVFADVHFSPDSTYFIKNGVIYSMNDGHYVFYQQATNQHALKLQFANDGRSFAQVLDNGLVQIFDSSFTLQKEVCLRAN